jgi:arsenite-transporting ATPase
MCARLPQEVDPTPDSADLEQMEWAQDGFFQDLASSIPGIDEAMSFAEVMKQVGTAAARAGAAWARSVVDLRGQRLALRPRDHAAPFLNTLPSFALPSPAQQVQSMDYSTIVFDTAPTGHTLRLLNFPTLLEKGLNKLVSLKATMGGMVGQVGGARGEEGDQPDARAFGNLSDARRQHGPAGQVWAALRP